MKGSERPFRSEHYQYKVCEIQLDFTKGTPTSWDNSHSLYGESISEIDQEMLLTANQKAIDIIFKIIQEPNKMTDVQLRVMEAIKMGMTQVEASKYLCLSQYNSNIAKSLNGNAIYKKDGTVIRHGGVGLKIIKYCLASDEYRLAIKELLELEMGGSMLRLTQSWFDSPFDFFFWLHDPLDLTLKISSSLINNIINKYVEYYTLNSHLKLPIKNICSNIVFRKHKLNKLITFKMYRDILNTKYEYIKENIIYNRSKLI